MGLFDEIEIKCRIPGLEHTNYKSKPFQTKQLFNRMFQYRINEDRSFERITKMSPQLTDFTIEAHSLVQDAHGSFWVDIVIAVNKEGMASVTVLEYEEDDDE